MISNCQPRVNFINILWGAFTNSDPKSPKKDSQVKQLFCAFGICVHEAVHKHVDESDTYLLSKTKQLFWNELTYISNFGQFIMTSDSINHELGGGKGLYAWHHLRINPNLVIPWQICRREKSDVFVAADDAVDVLEGVFVGRGDGAGVTHPEVDRVRRLSEGLACPQKLYICDCYFVTTNIYKTWTIYFIKYIFFITKMV